ncbi:MAG TPA: amidohydrolase family protein [Acidobacteriota bacterium]|nr:amidohydrolase family protein [Acidobacteriota bacterium]
MSRIILLSLLTVCLAAGAVAAQDRLPVHGKRVQHLVITNAMMVDGNGTPAQGPVDIVLDGNRIVRVDSSNKNAEYLKNADAILDATGKYVLPGFINMHAHLQDERAGKAIPFEYQYKLWLGSGITTIRDVGSDIDKAVTERQKSASNSIAAPRMFLYFMVPGGNTEDEIRKKVRDFKAKGADGLKFLSIDHQTFAIAADEAKKQGLKMAYHIGVKDVNALDVSAAGITSIEHWYGVPDAALEGVQHFPADFNYSNELDRFRYAGRLWREANPEKLKGVLQKMVDSNVAWDPTFCIYEASRDLQRAITQPWFNEYLHPSLEAYFAPNPANHGSFFWGWTNTDEVYWKENYRIWMAAVKDFAQRGGVVTTGEDAGFIYEMYGFCFLRELELHEEAGFQPLEVIQHATGNGARVLGKATELGRIKPGYLADLVVVNGNPLENLHVLFPTGINPALDQQHAGKGGIEWTIKDGIQYHAPTLFAEVRKMVQDARAAK